MTDSKSPAKKMKIAICSDQKYPVNECIIEHVKEMGHEVELFGALRSGNEEPWAQVAFQAAEAVARGDCDEGIFFCWTGTGISMAANKIPGIRAALCTDPVTAAGARVWNHANVLCLSNRLMSNEVAQEIVNVWFDTPDEKNKGTKGVEILNDLEKKYLNKKN